MGLNDGFKARVRGDTVSSDLYTMSMQAKVFGGLIAISDGTITITKSTKSPPWSCRVDEIRGIREKRAGFTNGFLSIDAHGSPAISGVMEAQQAANAIVFSGGQFSKIAPLVEALRALEPSGAGGPDPLKKVRTTKPKQMKQLDGMAVHLNDGEVVDAVVFGTYETPILGQDSVRSGILAATEQRLVFFAKKLGGFDMESYDYARLSSFEQSDSMMGSKFTFFASGNTVTLKWINDRFGDDFAATVRTRMHAAQSSATAAVSEPVRSKSTAEQIRELADLHREGLLTDEEFASAKAGVLRS